MVSTPALKDFPTFPFHLQTSIGVPGVPPMSPLEPSVHSLQQMQALEPAPSAHPLQTPTTTLPHPLAALPQMLQFPASLQHYLRLKEARESGEDFKGAALAGPHHHDAKPRQESPPGLPLPPPRSILEFFQQQYQMQQQQLQQVDENVPKPSIVIPKPVRGAPPPRHPSPFSSYRSDAASAAAAADAASSAPSSPAPRVTNFFIDRILSPNFGGARSKMAPADSAPPIGPPSPPPPERTPLQQHRQRPPPKSSPQQQPRPFSGVGGVNFDAELGKFLHGVASPFKLSHRVAKPSPSRPYPYPLSHLPPHHGGGGGGGPPFSPHLPSPLPSNHHQHHLHSRPDKHPVANPLHHSHHPFAPTGLPLPPPRSSTPTTPRPTAASTPGGYSPRSRASPRSPALSPLGAASGNASDTASESSSSASSPRKSPGSAGAAAAATGGSGGQKPGGEPMLWPAWVYCTRYSDRPSAGPRSRRSRKRESSPGSGSGAGAEKRPRTAFTNEQLARLKSEFNENRYLTEKRRQDLASELKLNESQIKIWFQNKRAKIKKAQGRRSELAVHLMAQGLYNHATVTGEGSDDDDDEIRKPSEGDVGDDAADDDANRAADAIAFRGDAEQQFEGRGSSTPVDPVGIIDVVDTP